MNKKTIPEDFNLTLAIVDAIPVLCFFISIILISSIFKSKLFLLGAILMLCAGLSKVLWKMIVATKKKNIWFLFIQMRTIMPLGLILLIISLIINKELINFDLIIQSIISLPQLIFFVIGAFAMALMLIFGFVLDASKVKNNWIEQTTNIIAQLSFLIGIIIIC